MPFYTTFKSLALASVLLLAGANIATASDTVYVMTNRVGGIGNSVLIFNRDPIDGELRRIGLVDTEGLGGTVGLAGLAPNTTIPIEPAGQTPEVVTGSPNDALASQDSLVVSDTGRCLFAVNAGSNTITSFSIRNEGRFLDLAGVYPSGGSFPLSFTQRGNTAYVLNGGGAGSIVGFRHSDMTCTLSPLNEATRSLGNVDFNPPSLWFSPAQVAITPDGNGVIATVKGKHEIHYWSLSGLGFPSKPQVITASVGFVPFSFDFDGNGNLVVGEAFGAGTTVPSPSTGAVSTYAINEDGTLRLISASVPNGQTATCWLRYSNDTIYTSNNDGPTPSISTYAVNSKGQVTLLQSPAADAQSGIDRPVDIAVSSDGSSLYVLNTGSATETGPGTPSISYYNVLGEGGLELVDILDMGLPAGTSLSEFDDIQGVMGLAVL